MRRAPVIVMTALLLASLGCNIEDATEPDGDPAPEVVVLPASGSVEQGIPLDLAWILDEYHGWQDSVVVCCDTTRPPATEVYVGPGTGCSVGDLIQGKTYYWTLAATDSSGATHTFGPWSFAVRPFRNRVSPLPEHLTRNLEPDPLLSWSTAAASDSVSYYLAYVDTVNPPQRLAYAGPDSAFQLAGLAYETTYYWRVTAVDAADNTDTSGPWRFDTGPPAFMVDLTPTPGDSAAGLGRVVELAWAENWASAPVVNYVVFLDESPRPVTMVYAGTGNDVTLQDLRYGRTYYWMVTAFDGEGHTFTCGPWQLAINEFDVAADPTPADGSTLVSADGQLGWAPTRGQDIVVNWLVMLDTNDPPTTPVYTGPADSLSLADLDLSAGTTYHWRVTALDVDGFTCPMGPWSFTTAP